MRSRIFFLKFLFLFFLFLFYLTGVNSADARCTPSWNEYMCENSICGGKVLVKNCWEFCNAWCDCSFEDPCCNTDPSGNCVSCTVHCSECCGCGQDCGESRIYQDCPDYQVCSGSIAWTRSSPICQCSGNCYPAPILKNLNDDSLSPKNIFDEEEKIKLPINIGWNDVNEIVFQEPNKCPVKSYRYEISGPTYFEKKVSVFCPTLEECKTTFDQAKQNGDLETMNKAHAVADRFRNYVTNPDGTEKVADSGPTYNYATKEYDYYLGSENQDIVRDDLKTAKEKGCLLRSDDNYKLRARACLDSTGKDCGKWSDYKNFSTSPVPELVSPYDPDWQDGKDGFSDIPVLLDWCDIASTQSWILNIYLAENGNEICHPWLISGENCESVVLRKEKRPPPYPNEETLNSELQDEKGYFTKNTEYLWETAACLREDGIDCSEFGQKWSFKTVGILTAFKLLSPPNDPEENQAAGLPVLLDWEDKPGINSFIYEINSGEITGTTSVSQITLNYLKLSLNASYDWKVKPCWDYGGKKCEENWSEEWHFKTTGAAPKLSLPNSNATEVIIPAKLDWQDVSGAGSYRYEVSSAVGFNALAATGTVEVSEVSVDYPKLKMLNDYWWRAKTCADKLGSICGKWSEIRKFKTFKLSTPSNPSPKDGGEFFTYEKYISWSQVSGAKSYQYTIDYDSNNPPSDEKKEGCSTLVGTKIIPPEIIISPPVSASFECLGQYHWSARACLDMNCQETGDWAGPWAFNFVQTTPPAVHGLVLCGRITDDPDTLWDEKEPCQFKHLFLLLKNILDFLLWRLGLIILVLLVIAVGVIYYFSTGAPTAMMKVKSILKSAGMGYLIIFLAWIFINLFLAIIGFQAGIFGHWWEIKF